MLGTLSFLSWALERALFVGLSRHRALSPNLFRIHVGRPHLLERFCALSSKMLYGMVSMTQRIFFDQCRLALFD